MGGGPEPEPVPEPQELQNAARARTAETESNILVRGERLNLCRISATRSHATNIGRTCCGSGGGAKRGPRPDSAVERIVVITVTVDVATFEPSMGEDAGATPHVDAIGAPVQVQFTV